MVSFKESAHRVAQATFLVLELRRQGFVLDFILSGVSCHAVERIRLL